MATLFTTFLASLLLTMTVITTAIADEPRPPYSLRIASKEDVRILDMATDPITGDIIAVGVTKSKDLPGMEPGIYHSLTIDKNNGFVMRFNADGSKLRFTAVIGGAEDDEITGIAIAQSGDILLTGNTESGRNSFPFTPNALDNAAKIGEHEAFFAVLSLDGKSLKYATFLGGDKYESATDILALTNETTVIVGETESGIQFPGVSATSSTSGADAFISVIIVSGGDHTQNHNIKSTLLSGKERDYCTGVSAFPNGRFAVTGGTSSKDFPVTVSAPACQYKSKYDAFAAVFDAALNRLSVWCFGGSNNDAGLSIATLNNNLIGICGTTSSNDLPLAEKKLFSTLSGNTDAFAVIFPVSAPGILQFASYLGGNDNEAAASIAFTERDGLVVAGTTSSPNFPITGFDKLTEKFSGKTDCFISVISPGRAKLLYSTTFGGPKPDSLSKVLLTPDDGFIACGSTISDTAFRPKFVNSSPTDDDHTAGFISRCTVRPNVYSLLTALQFPDTFIGTTKVDSVFIMATGFGVTECSPYIKDDLQGNFRLVSTQKITLPSGERDTIYVIFEPKTAGLKKATLIFISDKKDTLRSLIALTGTGKSPVVLTSSPLNFEDTEVETDSPPLNLTIKNLTSETCKVDTVFCEGNDAPFFRIPTSFPLFIPANMSGSVGVIFRPTERRKFSCRVVIKTSRGTLEGVVTGTGIGAEVIAGEQTLDFDSVTIGDTTPRTLELRNVGQKDAMYSLSIENNPNDDYSLSEPVTGLLSPNGTKNVRITFAPKTTGVSKATFLVAGEKFPAKRVTLTGVGVMPPMLSVDIQIDSLRANIGEKVSIPLRIRSADGLPKYGSRKYKATLRYNGTVLGIDSTNLINYNSQASVPPWRTITLSGTYTFPIAADSVLCRAELIAALGDTNFSAVELTALQWFDDKGDEVRSKFRVQNGSVSIADADNDGLPNGTVMTLISYPLPAIGTLYFKVSSPVENPVLTLYSLTGVAAARVKLTMAPNTVQTFLISTHQFGPGSYYAVLSAGTFTAVSRCVIFTP